MSKSKLNFQDLSDRVWFGMKTRQDNDLTDCIGVFYGKNDIELSWPIRQGIICDEN